MKSAVIYNEKIREYDLGHVLTKDRYENFISLFEKELGSNPDFEIVEPSYATDDELKFVHTEEYIGRIKRYESRDPFDTPLSQSLVRAARLLAGAGKLAGELVQSRQFGKAFVVGGGVQHARKDHEKGFGVFSDVGICAENLKRYQGVNRILILDTDAHAGDGVYEIFADDPRVLYISVHQDPRTLYPGKGFIKDTGTGTGKGYSVNIPLPPRSGDKAYEFVLDNIFRPLAEEFSPDLILLVDGSDPHFTDRITDMGLTLQGIHMVGNIVRTTADKICEGKVVDFIGSGYSYDQNVVSMGWLSSIAGLTGVDLKLKERHPIPRSLKSDTGLKEAMEITDSIKGILSSTWGCFSS